MNPVTSVRGIRSVRKATVTNLGSVFVKMVGEVYTAILVSTQRIVEVTFENFDISKTVF